MSISLIRSASGSNIINRIARFFLKSYEPKPQQDDAQSPPQSMSVVRNRRRRLLLEADPHCAYCGCEVTNRDSSVDHVLPKSRGGVCGWPENNFVLACVECNGDKGNLLLTEWAIDIRLRIAAIQSLEKRDAVHSLLARMEYLQRILVRLDCMVAGGVYVHELKRDSETFAPRCPGYPKLKSDGKVKRHQFISTGRRYAILSRVTGELVLTDLHLTEAVEYLKTNGADPDTPLCLWGYQQMFHAAFNIPDYRTPGGGTSTDVSDCGDTPDGEQARAA